ncbi:uncharacterized protein [Amphiura filiformis]
MSINQAYGQPHPTDEILDTLTSLLRCVICQQKLNQPKILPCHHSCCLSCMEGQTSGGEILCPECIIGYRLPRGGVTGFPDDMKTKALLYFQENWHEIQQQSKPSQSARHHHNSLSHSQVTNRISEVIAELHQLRMRVKDFKTCGDLWHKVIQSKDSVVVMTEKGRPLENVAGVLRMRRQQLHDRLDAFLKEETQSVYEKAEYQINRATEYCVYVESRLKKQDQITEEDTMHMQGQCAVISHQIDKLLSKLTDQIVSMPLKIVRAVDDDISDTHRPNSFYGVDVAVQATLVEPRRSSGSGNMINREVSFSDMHPLSRETSFRRSRKEKGYPDRLRSPSRVTSSGYGQQRSFNDRQSSTESMITRGREYSRQHDPSNSYKHRIEPHKFQTPQVPGLVLRTSVMQPSNRVIQTDYCRSLHRVKAFGRNWFGGRGSRLGPACLCVTNDDILVVTDGTNHCVRLCTMSGLSVDSYLGYSAVLQYFRDPQGVCEDKSRRYLYVTDKEQACVLKFDLETGDLIETMESQGRPMGATCDQNGTLFVCDNAQHCVTVFHSNGTFIGNIGGKGRDDGEFMHPHSVAVAPDNKVWVTDCNNHRLQVFTPTGKFIKSVGSKGSGLGQLKNPKGLAIDHRGWIHVADYGNRRLQVFDSSGKPAVVFGKEETNLHWEGGPVGIAITQSKNKSDQERIFVSYRGDHRIAVFMIQYDE